MTSTPPSALRKPQQGPKLEVEQQPLVFHHIGIACRNIEREAQAWKALGYDQEGDVFADPTQGIRGLFMTGPGPRLELLEPYEGALTLKPWLDRGIVAYHQAFLAPNLAAEIARLEDQGARLIVEPVSAVAFDGKKIAFLALRNTFLVELIEA